MTQSYAPSLRRTTQLAGPLRGLFWTDKGKGAWIAAMVCRLYRILPLGSPFIYYMIWSKRMLHFKSYVSAATCPPCVVTGRSTGNAAFGNAYLRPIRFPSGRRANQLQPPDPPARTQRTRPNIRPVHGRTVARMTDALHAKGLSLA